MLPLQIGMISLTAGIKQLFGARSVILDPAPPPSSLRHDCNLPSNALKARNPKY